ncbi:MAG: hypothetical protein ABI472_24165 [Ginsengibacter sp.]
MDDMELKNIWKEYDQKMNEAKVLNLQSWVVNLKTFEYLQTHKAQSKLRSLSSFKKWAIALGILWVLFLGILAYGNHFQNIFFTVSVIIIIFFSIVAIAVYIKHIVLINKINYSESVIDAQKKLTALQASTINVNRVLWLQMPFYTIFFWSVKWITSDYKFWLISFPLTLFFTFLAIWLYRNISIKNADKKWFRLLLGNIEWTSIINAKRYLDEIEEFKKEK